MTKATLELHIIVAVYITRYHLFTYLLSDATLRQFDGGGTSDMHKIAVLFSIYANNYLVCKNIYLEMGLFFLKYFVKLHVASRKLQSTHKCASY